MRILIVEDELDLQASIRKKLESEAYTVDSTADGREGLFFAMEYPLDAAIIDIGLPGMTGIDIIKSLRTKNINLPILVLTARSRWQEKVEGLEAGADDYLTKPFQMEELLARLKALLRRGSGNTKAKMQCGCLSLNSESQQVLLNGQPLLLTAFEYRLLEYLMRQHTEVLSKTKLADYLYPHDEDRDSNVIEVIIGRLRKKIDPDGTLNPIETLRQRGYRFTLCDTKQ